MKKNWVKNLIATLGGYLVPILIITFFLIGTCTGDNTKSITRKVKRENRLEPKIANVKILDTIFQSSVNKIMSFDSIEIKILEKELDSLRKKAPQIRIDKNEEKRISFFKILNHAERQLDDLQEQLNRYNILNTGIYDTDICGYIIYLEFNEHPDQSVMDTKYRLLGPLFLYEDNLTRPGSFTKPN